MKFALDKFSLVEAARFSPEDLDRLTHIPITRSAEWAEYLAREVEQNRSRLSRVLFNGREIGSLCWRIEQDVERELVIMSVASSEPGISITAFLAKAVEAIAAAEKCESARFHTVRPGLVKYAHAHGWQTAEIVVRKTFPHV